MTKYEKFMIKVLPVTESGCWLWTGCIVKGYGQMGNNKKRVYAHRFSYEYHKGPIPDGLTIDHLCRVRCCVNPDHLEAVTNRENILRGTGISAKNYRKTHCHKGHEFIQDNTYVSKSGSRICTACQRERFIPAFPNSNIYDNQEAL